MTTLQRRAQTSRSVVARRRAVLGILAGVLALGAVLTPVVAVVGTVLLVVGGAASAAYLGLLWRLQQRKALRQRIRHLDRGPVAPEPAEPEAVGERG